LTPPILILTGVEREARALGKALGLPRLGLPFAACGHDRARVAAVGPGAGRLEERLPRLAEGLPSPILVSAGLCGGLAPSISRRDLVVPEAVLEGNERHLVAERLPGREARGALVTVAAIVATPEEKARLYLETGALAVDMESAPILAAARRRGWGALVVRAVSDDAQEALPAALLDAVDAGGRVRVARALVALTGWGFWRALALRRDTDAGLAAVAEALRPLVDRPVPPHAGGRNHRVPG
jgi:adenosylhomocysteine nucleosidase